jgi:hypothetical protein
MEEYKNYIQHKSLETLMGFVLITFVVAGVFVVGKTLNPERKFSEFSNSTLAQNDQF